MVISHTYDWSLLLEPFNASYTQLIPTSNLLLSLEKPGHWILREKFIEDHWGSLILYVYLNPDWLHFQWFTWGITSQVDSSREISENGEREKPEDLYECNDTAANTKTHQSSDVTDPCEPKWRFFTRKKCVISSYIEAYSTMRYFRANGSLM